jgi:hypothetical protein
MIFANSTKRFLFVCAVSFLCSVAATAVNFKDRIPGSAAENDFRIMHGIFLHAHATAFDQIPAGNPPEIFKDAGFTTLSDFVGRVRQYFREIKVDHTLLGFSEELIRDLALNKSLFPAPLKFIDGRAYFDCIPPDIKFGSELIELNGESLPLILENLNKVSNLKSPEGKWDDIRLTDSFAIYYFMAKGPRKDWLMKISSPKEAKVQTVRWTVADQGPALGWKRQSLNLPQFAKNAGAGFDNELKTAYLALNSFMPNGNEFVSDEIWNRYLHDFHKEAKARKSEYLVVDLRINRGGVMQFSATAAAWFLETPVEDKSWSKIRTRIIPYREHVVAINGFPDAAGALPKIEEFLSLNYADKREADGYFPAKNAEGKYRKLIPVAEAHHFKKIFVLIGGETYSAAVNFARLLKLGNKNVVLVGQETGSPGDGHSAEILITYKLPATKLLLTIPLARVNFSPLVPGQQAGRGLAPDIRMKNLASDFGASRDSMLDAVSRIIQKQ